MKGQAQILSQFQNLVKNQYGTLFSRVLY